VRFAFKNEVAQQTLTVAMHLIHCYLAACSGLRELGILRTERTPQGAALKSNRGGRLRCGQK
jgi:hypothetical protein